jgi:hypothetical protein
MDYIYDINLFDWDKESNTFTVNNESLYTNEHAEAHPNQRRQFYILNQRTGDRRRFRLTDINEDNLIFKSEDGFIAVIKLTNNGRRPLHSLASCLRG